jgi:WD40 repeat protein
MTEEPGVQIGPYKLLQEIGHGGMGVVYMAEQTEPVERRVALKIIKPGMDSRQVIARFEAERQALALMDHPSIAKVLDAATTDSGLPYFVMELVKGIPITKYCDEHHLTPHERLKLFIPVCQAVQHAHQKGIIHRDLKPSNVLVAQYDGKPVPKVIDFGVAKATTQKLTEKTLFTQLGQVVGTLEYMSPEQAEVNQLDIDTRSDIYSLGVLLYELLAGATPFDRQRLQSAAFDEMLRIIREEEPPRPSLRLSTIDTLPSVAANRRVEPQKLRSLVRGELDWIVMKALEKERARRYDTANAFAADLERFLNSEAVLACPPSSIYKLRKFVHRNRGPVAAATGLLLVLCLGLAGTILGMTQAKQQSNRAERESKRAVDALAAEKLARADEAERRREAEDLRSQAVELAASRRRQLYFSQMDLAGQAVFEPGGVRNALNLLDSWRPKTGDAELRGWEWFYVNTLCHQDLFTLRVPGDHDLHGQSSVAWSPDGRWIAASGTDGSVYVWEVLSRRVARIFRGHAGGITAIAWNPDSERLASASDDKTIKIWDISSEGDVQTLQVDDVIQAVAWSPDGGQLATIQIDKDEDVQMWSIRIWDAETAREELRFADGIVEFDNRPVSLAWRQDGEQLATGNWNGSIQLWSIPDGELTNSLIGHGFPTTSVCYHPDGEQLASASFDGTVRVWNSAAGGDSMLTLSGHGGYVHALSWSPDGDWLASGGQDLTIRVWRATTGELARMWGGHTGEIRSTSWAPDSKMLASSAMDGTIRVWDAFDQGQPETLKAHSDLAWVVTWSPDGTRLASCSGEMGDAGDDRSVRIWNWQSDSGRLRLAHTLLGHREAVRGVCRDGRGDQDSEGGQKSRRGLEPRRPAVGRRRCRYD